MSEVKPNSRTEEDELERLDDEALVELIRERSNEPTIPVWVEDLSGKSALHRQTQVLADAAPYRLAACTTARPGDVTESMKSGLYKPASAYGEDGVPCLRMWRSSRSMRHTRLLAVRHQREDDFHWRVAADRRVISTPTPCLRDVHSPDPCGCLSHRHVWRPIRA